MEIDLPEVVAEVRAAFDRYEKALGDNDVATLNSVFREDPRTIRYGATENLYGHAEIETFRTARTPPGTRTISKTVISTYGRDHAVASTLYHRAERSGQSGPADADLGAVSGRLACRHSACKPDRRALTQELRRPLSAAP